MFRKFLQFASNVFKAFARFIKKTTIEVVNHAETVASMVAESVGWTTLIAALPFMIATPMWLEADLVIPFLGIAMTLLLATITVIRYDRGLIIATN